MRKKGGRKGKGKGMGVGFGLDGMVVNLTGLRAEKICICIYST